jgi:hypothetical protein
VPASATTIGHRAHATLAVMGQHLMLSRYLPMPCGRTNVSVRPSPWLVRKTHYCQHRIWQFPGVPIQGRLDLAFWSDGRDEGIGRHLRL